MTPADSNARFHSTAWSIVRRAGDDDSTARVEALEDLCASYWPPIYGWLRRDGHDPDRALDLTQAFFARILERGDIEQARPERGRFRSYLLAALKNFITNAREFDAAEKRGGKATILSIDFRDAESGYGCEPIDENATPDRIFERRWAKTVLDRALDRLAEHEADRGREELFTLLREFLSATPAAGRLQEIAEATERERGAVKVTLHRLRTRFADLVREEIGHTVDRPEDVDAELGRLLEAL